MVPVTERLGILTDEVSPKLDEALEWIRARGFRHVEIRMVDGFNIMNATDEQLDGIRRRVEEAGLFISGIASPVFKCPLDPDRPVQTGDTFGQSAADTVEDHFRLLDRAFRIAGRLGTSRIRIFSFWREMEPEAHEDEIVEHLAKAAAAAERAGIVLLLENEPSCNGGHANEVGRLAERVDSPALRVLWDPGNEAYTGRRAFPDGYDCVKHVLAHVHLKDAAVTEAGSRCVPIGRGTVDFAGQFAALAKAGYDGLFTIETHYVPDGGTQADGSEQTWAGLQNILSQMEQ